MKQNRSSLKLILYNFFKMQRQEDCTILAFLQDLPFYRYASLELQEVASVSIVKSKFTSNNSGSAFLIIDHMKILMTSVFLVKMLLDQNKTVVAYHYYLQLPDIISVAGLGKTFWDISNHFWSFESTLECFIHFSNTLQ